MGENLGFECEINTWGETTYARLSLTASATEEFDGPIQIVILLDRSLSTTHAADPGVSPVTLLERFKQMASKVVRDASKRENTEFSLILYDREAVVKVSLTGDSDSVLEAIELTSTRSEEGKKTNFKDAIQAACEVVEESQTQDSHALIVCITDGVPNYPDGETSETFLSGFVEKCLSDRPNVTLSMMGIGKDSLFGGPINMSIMQAMAYAGRGKCSRVDPGNMATASKAILSIVSNLVNTAATNVRIQCLGIENAFTTAGMLKKDGTAVWGTLQDGSTQTFFGELPSADAWKGLTFDVTYTVKGVTKTRRISIEQTGLTEEKHASRTMRKLQALSEFRKAHMAIFKWKEESTHDDQAGTDLDEWLKRTLLQAYRRSHPGELKDLIMDRYTEVMQGEIFRTGTFTAVMQEHAGAGSMEKESAEDERFVGTTTGMVLQSRGDYETANICKIRVWDPTAASDDATDATDADDATDAADASCMAASTDANDATDADNNSEKSLPCADIRSMAKTIVSITKSGARYIAHGSASAGIVVPEDDIWYDETWSEDLPLMRPSEKILQLKDQKTYLRVGQNEILSIGPLAATRAAMILEEAVGEIHTRSCSGSITYIAFATSEGQVKFLLLNKGGKSGTNALAELVRHVREVNPAKSSNSQIEDFIAMIGLTDDLEMLKQHAWLR